jgi:signal transduction histidine kinase/ActR/RegA family two-component response regulator
MQKSAVKHDRAACAQCTSGVLVLQARRRQAAATGLPAMLCFCSPLKFSKMKQSTARLHVDTPPVVLPNNQSQLAQLVREHDWANTPLGPMDEWQQSLRSVVSNMLNAWAFPMFVAWGPDLNTIYNDGYSQLLGGKHPWALGKPFWEIWPEIRLDLQPFLERVMAGETFYVEDLPLTTHRNGDEDTGWFTFSWSPVIDESGMIAGIYCVCTETTRMVQAEQHIRAEHQRLAELFQASPSFSAVLRGPQHVFETFNDAYQELVGFRAQEGKPVGEVLPEIVGQGFVQILDEVFATGKAYRGHAIQVELQKTAGDPASKAYVNLVFQPLVNDAGAVDGIFVQGHDVTAQHEAQVALETANKNKDEFLAMLAHELRNPLAPIGAAAELLQMAKLDDARVRKTSEVIGRQVRHMTHLIDDLLDVSRVTSGMVQLDPEPLDIRQVIADAIEQVSPLINTRRHQLVMNLAPGTATVHGDKKRLVQVLANILGNAAKYTPEGGRIELNTELRTSHVLIHVIDNGIGMDAELKQHAFELFTQAQRSADRAGGGLGLGLALARSLIELHKGTVHCDSPGPGKGSTFTLCLPTVPVALPGGGHGSAARVTASARPLRILVVDDNVDAASIMALFLEAAGHQVTIAHRPQEALQLAQQALPDVCILDIGLPDMDGYELVRRLRALPGSGNVMFIAITGYGQQSDREQGVRAGFDHFFVKPADLTGLAETLARFSTRVDAGPG